MLNPQGKAAPAAGGAREARHTTALPKKYPRNAETADHGAFYANAFAIKYRNFGPDSADPRHFTDPELIDLIGRITIVHDPALPDRGHSAISRIVTTDGRALDTISVAREFDRDEDEGRRADRIADSIEKALRGELRLPEVVAEKRAAPKGRIKAFAIEPSVTLNNQWSHRYTMVEITGLDRTGLLYDMTATISKLNLNIASAHVATFGERVVDVFYVTDLMGAQITSPTRQAAIKRALIALFKAAEGNGKQTKGAASEARAK